MRGLFAMTRARQQECRPDCRIGAKCGETGHAVTFFLICLQRRRDLAFRSRHSFIWRTTGLRTCFTSCVPGLSRHAGRIRACRTHAPRVQRSQPLETNDEQNEPICGPGNLRAAGRLPPCGEDARECRHGADTLERSRRNGDGRRSIIRTARSRSAASTSISTSTPSSPNSSRCCRRAADYLRSHPARHVLIQGNTDERGTSEYNLALGQRRSRGRDERAETLGVPATQLEAVSLGKENRSRSATTRMHGRRIAAPISSIVDRRAAATAASASGTAWQPAAAQRRAAAPDSYDARKRSTRRRPITYRFAFNADVRAGDAASATSAPTPRSH